MVKASTQLLFKALESHKGKLDQWIYKIVFSTINNLSTYNRKNPHNSMKILQNNEIHLFLHFSLQKSVSIFNQISFNC